MQEDYTRYLFTILLRTKQIYRQRLKVKSDELITTVQLLRKLDCIIFNPLRYNWNIIKIIFNEL